MSNEQKPVAWLNKDGVIVGHDEGGTAKPLYLHPAPPPGATDTLTHHEPYNCKRIKWDASAPITLNDGRIGVGTFSAPAVVAQLVEALESLLNDVGRANSMLGAVKARAALAAAKEAGYE